MTDKRLRELEREAADDPAKGTALARELERAGRANDARQTLDALIAQTRHVLELDHTQPDARARIAELNPYAWTGFIDISRHADRVELRVHEGTREPTLIRSIATKGRAHVLSCGDNFYVCDQEKHICLGTEQRIGEPHYDVPCTSVDKIALAEAKTFVGTRTVNAGNLGNWVGGDAPVRVLGVWRYVSVFHSEGQIGLNITGYSNGRGSAHLNGNIVIADQRIWHPALGRWNDLETDETQANAVYQHAREPLSAPQGTRLARNENRCGGARDLTSVHDHTGQTLLIEAPITIIEKLRALPEHYTAKRSAPYCWEQP